MSIYPPLSQVAYLEDMVNNWSYSLRSLEPDSQTSVTSKLNGAQTAETMQPTLAKSMVIAEEPSDPGLVKGGLQGTCAGSPAILDTTVANPTQVEEVLQGTIAENFQPAASMMNSFNVDGGNVTEAVNLSEDSPHIVFAKTNAGASIHSAEKVASQEEGFPKEVLLERNPFSSTDFVDPVIQGRSCSKSFKETCTGREVLEGKHLEELSVINGHIQSTQESSHSDCAQSLGQPTAGSHDLGKLGYTKVQMSSEFCNQSIPKLLVENESSDEAGKYKTDLQVQDSRTSESCDLLSESEVKCSYSCCVGCTSTLHQLVKKIIAQEWKLSSSCCTIEDVHDLVSALSSSLCSNIRSILTTEGCSSSENRRLRSRKLECRCESSKNKSENAMECVCHSGNDLSGEAGLSSVNQSESNLTYIFKDGVLIAAQSDKDSLFHCKYDTLCLCSLITLIGKHQPAFRLIWC
ncbi:Elongation factor Ts [Bienertia sinuspersici]